MRVYQLAGIALIAGTTACARISTHEEPAPIPSRRNASQSAVGRWALIGLMINGEDRISRNAVNGGASVFYTFGADGRFSIVSNDSIRETGAWSQDTTVLPKHFDHIPDVDGRPGPYVPGIFAVTGDTLRISLVAPNPARRHPSEFHSSPADSSWLLLFRRAAP
jgi:hypothetical protein